MQDQILCLAWSEQYFSFDMCFPEFRPLLRWRSSHSAKSKKLKNRLKFLVWRKPTVRQMWGFILKSFGVKNLIIYLGKLKLNNRSIKKMKGFKIFSPCFDSCDSCRVSYRTVQFFLGFYWPWRRHMNQNMGVFEFIFFAYRSYEKTNNMELLWCS